MDAAARLAVMADPTRARIVALLRGAPDGRALVGHLARDLGLRQPTISHHMRVLREAGVVEREPVGREAWYSLTPGDAEQLADIVAAPAAAPPTPPVDLDRIADDLGARYRGVLGRDTIRRHVQESHDLLSATTGVRMLASRTSAFAASRLEAALTHDAVPAACEVLFVCTQNAGRSQMAAALLRHLTGPDVVIRSAGSEPRGEIRSTIVSALDEIGVGIGGEFPKPLTDDVVRAADVVVTMGCGDACPVYPGIRYVDWDIADPAGLPLADVRRIRDEIELRVRELAADLRPA
ncbi:metalloregulator ArsR/SmtB family transcription factor [Microbacterium limosum]|uniref:Metalloregulator ArsR/SmtB family transcription factor n=1 Tax=Microbacterium limosum TaxID=3079935 RepID=A0AAU0MF21_9MICO|nr:metalloregulator ArsR/SmtB family transcription factor [Microbacterium sp. Y20]WOQ68911.1 metalloregulator ArsR/SmtB family transcription factor [Microbacterium sp. Y20]